MAESAKSTIASDGDFNFAEAIFEKNKNSKDDLNRRKRAASKDKSAKLKPEQFQKGVESMEIDEVENGLSSARSSSSSSSRTGHVIATSENKSNTPNLGVEKEDNGVSLEFFNTKMDDFRSELRSLIFEAVSGRASQPPEGISDLNHGHGKQYGRRRNHSFSESDEDSDVLTQSRFKIPKLSDNKGNVDVAVDEQVEDLFHEDDCINDKNFVADEDQEFEDSLGADYSITDKVGKDINPKIATIINNMFANILPAENLSNIMDKYSERPGNLNIWLPIINKEVWGRIQSGARSHDVKLQKSSNKLARCSYSLATLADDLMVLKKSCPADKQSDFKGAIKKVLDVLAMISATSQEFSQHRRSVLRTENFDLAYQVCAASNNTDVGALPKLLFGDELPRKIKEYKEANLLSARSSSNSSTSKYQNTSNHFRPYKGNSQHADKGKSFLGQRKTSQKGGGSKSSYQNQKSWKYDKKK